MERPLLRILDLDGGPGEMGRDHAGEIRTYAADRVTLAGSPWWLETPVSVGFGPDRDWRIPV